MQCFYNGNFLLVAQKKKFYLLEQLNVCKKLQGKFFAVKLKNRKGIYLKGINSVGAGKSVEHIQYNIDLIFVSFFDQKLRCTNIDLFVHKVGMIALTALNE